MSNVYGVDGSSSAGNALDVGLTYMSPDALLAYCQMQLGNLDSDIKVQMDGQWTQLKEREAVEKVQSYLESFGSQGPSDAGAMGTCVDAFTKAIASLPPGDPVAGQLKQQCDQMINKYGYNPGGPEEAVLPNHLVKTVYTPQTLSNRPQNDEWKGTIDGVSNLSQDIKSNSEIEMLKLQDLVSQRQQAVQLASSMMSKEDQTLETLAKAIGQ